MHPNRIRFLTENGHEAPYDAIRNYPANLGRRSSTPSPMIPTNYGVSTKPRKDTLYSRDEVKLLNVHKAEYREQTTPELRKKVVIERILPDIFNHWRSQGTAPNDEEESNSRVKVNPTICSLVRADNILIRNLLHGSVITGVRSQAPKRFTRI